MKLVTAIIKPFKLDEVREALSAIGVTGITVTSPPASASLTVNPSSVAGGGSVTATFSNVTFPQTSDWIGVYRQGDPDNAYVDYQWTSSCSKAIGSLAVSAGFCDFNMPSPATQTTYEMRLFRAASFSRLATSGGITVTVVPASLSVNPTTVAGGGSTTATFSNVSSPQTGDWLGLYRSGDPDIAYLNYEWTSSCTKTIGSTPATAGACPFIMPITSGTFELRLFRAASFTRLATSQPITVNVATLTANPTTVSRGASTTATWNFVSNPQTGDWIGLYRTGDPDNAYLDYEWTSSCTKTLGSTPQAAGACLFPMPTTPGQYQLRLYRASSFTLVAFSGTITVP